MSREPDALRREAKEAKEAWSRFGLRDQGSAAERSAWTRVAKATAALHEANVERLAEHMARMFDGWMPRTGPYLDELTTADQWRKVARYALEDFDA